VPQPDGSPVVLDTSFPKGKALADWVQVIAPTLPYGQIPAKEIFWNLVGTPKSGQVWGRSAGNAPGQPQPRFVTINTPAAAPADQQCGRVVHLDAHIVDAARTSNLPPGTPAVPGQAPAAGGAFPNNCGSTLSGAEGVMVFFLFDLTACIQTDTAPPVAPPIIP
jgi:hypothetical protein